MITKPELRSWLQDQLEKNNDLYSIDRNELIRRINAVFKDLIETFELENSISK